MRTDSAIRRQQAERLKQARAAAGFATAALAIQKFGWKSSTYMAHENGQNGVPADAAVSYGASYRVEPGWLLTGVGKGPRGSKHKTSPPDLSGVTLGQQDFAAVGRFDASFSMGPGSLIADNPEPLGYWMVETQWLHSISRAAAADLAIVRCSGDSMQTTLFDGDWVLVDRTQRRLSREGIYAIRVGDDAWVKRISLNIKSKKIRVLSDNPTTPAQPDVGEDELLIIGRVIALIARRVV